MDFNHAGYFAAIVAETQEEDPNSAVNMILDAVEEDPEILVSICQAAVDLAKLSPPFRTLTTDFIDGVEEF